MRALILTLAAAVAALPALAADRKVEEALAKAQAHLDKGNVDEAVKAARKVAGQGVEGQVAVATIEWRAGQPEEAKASFAKARELAAGATGAVKADALAAVSGFELVMGSGSSALKVAEEAVAAEATASALAAQARAQARLGQAGAAMQAADRAVQADANNAMAHVARGDALLASGRAGEAEAEFRKAAELAPKAALPHARLALALLASGKNAEAEAAARKSSEIDPRSAEAFAILGKAILAVDTNRWNDAIAQAQQGAFLARNGSAYIEVEVGRIFEANGNVQQATSSYQRALQIDPGYVPARLALIQAQIRQNQVDAALAETQKLAQEMPQSGDVQYQLGRLMMRKGDWPGATAALEKAAAAMPDHALAHASLGTTYQYVRRSQDALKEYKRAVELDPKNLDFRTTYGILLGIDKQYDAGVVELKRVVESPGYKDADAWMNLGWLYRNMQPRRGEESVAAYRKALELDPKNEQAALGLGWALNYLKNYDEAIKVFQQAAAIAPDVAGEAHAGAGWAYLFKKDVAQAKAALEKAKAAGRNDAKLAENIGLVEKGEALRAAAAEEAERQQHAPRVDALQDVGTLCQVAQGGRDAGSRRKAMSDLRKHGGDGVSCLIRGLRDSEFSVRMAAVNALGSIGPPAKSAVTYLLQAAAEARTTASAATPSAADLKREAQENDFRNAIRDAVNRIQGRS